MEPTKEELLFGRIALHNKLISSDQYSQALAWRRQTDDVNQDFGRLLKAKGFLDDKQYRGVRKAQEKALTGKGHTSQAAKFLARGMTSDGSAPAGKPSGGAGAAPNAAPVAAPVAAPSAAPVAAEPPAFEPGDIRDEVPSEPEPVAAAVQSVPATAKQRHKRPADANARKTMLALLKKARQSKASDLHMSCGAKPFFRLNGAISYLNMPVITPKQGELYAASLVTDDEWSTFRQNNDWDGSIDLGPLGRFRSNVMRQRRGISAVYRVINSSIPSLADLGLPEDFERFTTFHQGLVLVTGAAGSGKSSTLAALIELVNKNRKDHIITMEDPIEYVFEGKSCNVTQRQIDVHTRSWGNALRASLREDPDVIMVGEMRDLDTVQLAITAAETGHLVYGTLHTTSATRTIDRLLDVFPPGEQSQIRAMVSESLKGVISQQLLPTVDGKSRVCAYEVLCWTPAVANLIREGTTYKLVSVLQTGKKLGMVMMDESIRKLLNAGKITKDVARKNALNPKLFQ